MKGSTMLALTKFDFIDTPNAATTTPHYVSAEWLLSRRALQ